MTTRGPGGEAAFSAGIDGLLAYAKAFQATIEALRQQHDEERRQRDAEVTSLKAEVERLRSRLDARVCPEASGATPGAEPAAETSGLERTDLFQLLAADRLCEDDAIASLEALQRKDVLAAAAALKHLRGPSGELTAAVKAYAVLWERRNSSALMKRAARLVRELLVLRAARREGMEQHEKIVETMMTAFADVFTPEVAAKNKKDLQSQLKKACAECFLPDGDETSGKRRRYRQPRHRDRRRGQGQDQEAAAPAAHEDPAGEAAVGEPGGPPEADPADGDAAAPMTPRGDEEKKNPDVGGVRIVVQNGQIDAYYWHDDDDDESCRTAHTFPKWSPAYKKYPARLDAAWWQDEQAASSADAAAGVGHSRPLPEHGVAAATDDLEVAQKIVDFLEWPATCVSESEQPLLDLRWQLQDERWGYRGDAKSAVWAMDGLVDVFETCTSDDAQQAALAALREVFRGQVLVMGVPCREQFQDEEDLYWKNEELRGRLAEALKERAESKDLADTIVQVLARSQDLDQVLAVVRRHGQADGSALIKVALDETLYHLEEHLTALDSDEVQHSSKAQQVKKIFARLAKRQDDPDARAAWNELTDVTDGWIADSVQEWIFQVEARNMNRNRGLAKCQLVAIIFGIDDGLVWPLRDCARSWNKQEHLYGILRAICSHHDYVACDDWQGDAGWNVSACFVDYLDDKDTKDVANIPQGIRSAFAGAMGCINRGGLAAGMEGEQPAGVKHGIIDKVMSRLLWMGEATQDADEPGFHHELLWSITQLFGLEAASWTEYTHSDGRLSYYNRETKTFVWDKPDCLKSADEKETKEGLEDQGQPAELLGHWKDKVQELAWHLRKRSFYWNSASYDCEAVVRLAWELLRC